MARRKKRYEERLDIGFRRHEDDDLIRWLRQFEDAPYGAKSRAVKKALRRGLGFGEPAAPPIAAPVLDLGEVRQVVQAAVTEALSHFEGFVAGAAVTTPTSEEDDVIEFYLDKLGASLMLDDDD